MSLKWLVVVFSRFQFDFHKRMAEISEEWTINNDRPSTVKRPSQAQQWHVIGNGGHLGLRSLLHNPNCGDAIQLHMQDSSRAA